ncbi:myb/SANT-like DNA-binding domain-containing protein 4 isoform X2 [Colias croceus]|uniref:myb/SANT-like DNA-binding domain-containing protein 4 isoform X2 n=1 Tax=Colias crocea TaxID=72248 RepID=UPI001E27C30D|nr:myb/SANT-like DNA-binding domain-containing protein 4 isoform X2 [Colias croceus]
MDGKDDNSRCASLRSKERSANFTKAEMDGLRNLIIKHRNILFCKKTTGNINKQKESAWQSVKCEFNAFASTPRTIKQLRDKFDNLKRVAKKDRRKEGQEMRHTGGGPQPEEDSTDWLRSITPSSINGDEAIYDDGTHTILKTEYASTNEVLTDTDDPLTSEKLDASTPYSSLKRPMASPLQCGGKKERMAESDNVVQQLLREKEIQYNKSTESLQELELKKIRESIRHALEVHEQKIRQNEELHQLQLQKLKLEIKILKNNLDL